MKRDLTNFRFGLLTVLAESEPRSGRRMWRVRCVCGVEKAIREETLVAGRAKSCGCSSNRFRKSKMDKTNNLINQHFGRLWVVSRAESIRSGGKPYSAWECKCSCGNIVTVRGAYLRNGKTKSCGCLQREMVCGVPGRVGFNNLLAAYKKGAEKRGLEWALSDEEFRSLVTEGCFYCGRAPQQVSVRQSKNGQFMYNGIDRKNNSLGYTIDNVVPCCGTHNKMKGTMSSEEFVANCEVVVRHKNRATLGAKA